MNMNTNNINTDINTNTHIGTNFNINTHSETCTSIQGNPADRDGLEPANGCRKKRRL